MGALRHARQRLRVGTRSVEGKGGSAVEILTSRGFTNALPEFAPSANTWRWQTTVGRLELDLDHILYDPSTLVPIEARVLEAGNSDHLPVVATFELSRRKG